MAINNTSNVKGGVTTINATVVVPSLTTEERQKLTRVLEDGVPNVVEEKETPKGTISLERVYTPPVITPPPEVIVTQTASQEPPELQQEVAEDTNPTQNNMGLFGDNELFVAELMKAVSILDDDTQEAVKALLDSMTPEDYMEVVGGVLKDEMAQVFSDPAKMMQMMQGTLDIKSAVINKVITELMSRALAGKKKAVDVMEILSSDEALLAYVKDECNDLTVLPDSVHNAALCLRENVTANMFIDFGISGLLSNRKSTIQLINLGLLIKVESGWRNQPARKTPSIFRKIFSYDGLTN